MRKDFSGKAVLLPTYGYGVPTVTPPVATSDPTKTSRGKIAVAPNIPSLTHGRILPFGLPEKPEFPATKIGKYLRCHDFATSS
jgi:hypothetical protein